MPRLPLVAALLLFFVLAASSVYSTVKVKVFSYGKYTVRLAFDNTTIATSKVVLASVDYDQNIVNFVAVHSAGAVSTAYVCKQVSQQRVIYGPIGCSKNAHADNCFADSLTVDRYRDVLYSTWNYSKESSECFALGGMGELRLCAGPLRLALDNKDAYLPDRHYTTKDFLQSRMRFVECLTGPFAMSPCLVEIRMVLPGFSLETDCEDPLYGISYDGEYVVDDIDPYPGLISELWKVYVSSTKSRLRLFLVRDSVVSYGFRVVLGAIPSEDTEPDLYYYSEVMFAPDTATEGSLLFFLPWLDYIQGNTVYAMNFYANDTFACNINFTFPSNPTTYTLLPPDPVTAANYSIAQIPSRYYTTRICNYQVCGRTFDGMLTNPYCGEGEVAGGDVVYSDPRYPHLPIYVPPNPTLDFRFDCEEMYPKAATFLNYDNVEVARMALASGRCFAPFLDPAAIRAQTSPYEREIQCNKMGGTPYTRAKSYCSRPIIMPIRCREGWIYFDQKCIYKFDPLTENRYSSVLDQGNEMCTLLYQGAQALTYIDTYLEIFLRDYFTFWKFEGTKRAAYRVPVPGTSLCSCFSSIDLSDEETRLVNCPCYEALINNTYSIFPVCFYPITLTDAEPPYSFVQISYESARLYTYGQEGPFFGGYQAQCRCFPGWTGQICETPTCPLADMLVSFSEDEVTSPTLNFFRRCMTFGNGRCNNGNPRICECLPGFGPSASILDTLPTLYQFNEIPCNCPASSKSSGSFQINELVYLNQDVVYLPCDGIYHGQCWTFNNTAPGYCMCTLRPNILLGGMEPSFDGKACTSSVPIQPYMSRVINGPITTKLCNRKGVSCPSGETVYNEVGNPYDPRCYSEVDGSALDGCQCDNGWGGNACTCPAPIDYAYERILEKTDDSVYLYTNMGFKYFIRYVRVKAACGAVTEVTVSNYVGRESESEVCVYTDTEANGDMNYECAPTEAYEYVTLKGWNTVVGCSLEAKEENYKLCGYENTTNAYSGRFFDIAAYRGFGKSLENQDMFMSTLGCTNTDCMCNSNYTGPLCGVAVSSIRIEDVEIAGVKTQVWAKTVCGQSTLNPKLDDPVAGRGAPSYEDGRCECNVISSVDPTGKLGNVVEKFEGRACQCATGLNRVNGEVELCSGHGTCKDPSFEYGLCSVDIETYEADALYTPYVETIAPTGNEWNYNDLVATRDSYVILEAEQIMPHPTTSPTTSPSQSPTEGPTASPTIEDRIYFYYGYSSNHGFLGNRATTTANCVSNSWRLSTEIQAQCRAYTALLSYSGDSVGGFPVKHHFSPTSGVYGPTDIFIGQWNTMFSSGFGNLLSNSLATALGIAPSTYFTGTQGNGDTFYNCNGWTDAGTILTYIYGNSDVRTFGWIYDDTRTCGNAGIVVCACIQGTQTRSPTTGAPTTVSPTNTMSPTTRSPTVPTPFPTDPPTALEPVSIYFYKSPSTYSGAMGNRAATDAICNDGGTELGPTIWAGCTDVTGLLSYTGDTISDYPTKFGFHSTVLVYGKTLKNIGRWDTMFSGTLVNSLASADVLTNWPAYTYRTGATASGGVTSNCVDWTSSAALPTSGTLGDGGVVFSWWISSGLMGCDISYLPIVCMCVHRGPPVTLSPTTSTPTAPSQSPTTSTPTTPSRSPTTSAPASYPDGIILYPGAGTLGTFASRTSEDAACLASADSTYFPYGTCTGAFLFAGYSGFNLNSMDAVHGFPSSTPVYGLNGLLIQNTWTDLWSGSILNSLYSAGVLSSGQRWWSGVNPAGTYSPTTSCVGWSSSSSSSTGRTGDSSSTTGTWIASSNTACNLFSYRVCACIKIGTRSPVPPTSYPTTVSPTSPTSSPTITVPTMPTIAPTTRAPSDSPTSMPTITPSSFPTASPTMFLSVPVLFKIPEGTLISTFRSPYDIDYTPPKSNPPINVSIAVSMPMVPIAWTNSTYRVYDDNAGETVTVFLSGACNPANPSNVPGTAILQDDGIYRCPTREICILTPDCTDNLTPATLAPTASGFPDLRACVCSFTETTYPGVEHSTLTPYRSVELFNGSFIVASPQTPPYDVVGTFECNNFVQRTINCQLLGSNFTYVDRCPNEPIKCNYNSTIGRFFGAFYDQNPNYLYANLPFSSWTEGHYRGVASLLNYLVYRYPTSGFLADPFLSDGGLIWSQYTWFNITGVGLVFSQALTHTDIVTKTYLPMVIQDEPFIYSGNGGPPAHVTRPFTYTDTQSFVRCYADSITTNLAPECDNLLWNNSDSELAKSAGLDTYYNVSYAREILSVTVTFTAAVNYVTALEVYVTGVNLCGSYISANATYVGQKLVFKCPQNFFDGDAERAGNKSLRIRLLGPVDVYDMPGSTLNSEFIPSPTDSLFGDIGFSYYASLIQKTFPIIYPGYDLMMKFAGVFTSSLWPTRLFSQQLGADTDLAYNLMFLPNSLPFDVSYNYTNPVDASGQDINEIMTEIEDAIVDNNTYPHNYPLASWASAYTTEPVNYSNPEHQAYLQKVFEDYLSIRLCGAEDVQCQTFQLGQCVIQSGPGGKQRWYNVGKANADYDFEGKEGGCDCYSSYDRGFFAYELSCQVCEPGFGPLDPLELQLSLEYNQMVAQVYSSDLLTSIYNKDFESNWICRFPFAPDPVLASIATINACSGHGILSANVTEKTNVPFTVFDSQYIAGCSELIFTEQQRTFEFNAADTESVYGLIYNENGGSDSLITIVGGVNEYTVYYNFHECVLSDCAPELDLDRDDLPLVPWLCAIQCFSSSGDTSTLFMEDTLLCQGAEIYTVGFASLPARQIDLFRLLLTI